MKDLDGVKPYGDAPYKRPRDAATLILLRNPQGDPDVLMGRRSAALAFMPGLYVFPGGRTERCDFSAPRTGRLHEADERRLVDGLGARGSKSRAEALALSAIRETHEETGLLLGRQSAPGHKLTAPQWRPFYAHGIVPDLSGIRLLGRAITPPGRNRRFDTRFFVANADAIANGGEPVANSDEELEEVSWIRLADASAMKVHPITKTMIGIVIDRLKNDPRLEKSPPVPFFRTEHRRFVHTLE
jgi:8-oxo-dGTP pyrophosphatase MutT (NUDIX family)